MSIHGPRNHTPLLKWFATNTLLAGIFALLWLVLRSGTKPNRLAYPCQQAAFTTASLAFGAPVVGALVTAHRAAGRLLRNRLALTVAAVGLFATVGLYGFLSQSSAANVKRYDPPPDSRASVFHVSDCPEEPIGDRFVGLEYLVDLMGREGVKLYKSPTDSLLSGPDGIVGGNDVVVIKINYQWTGCGGTNTELLSGLIRLLVDHPDGFTGEIVVGENAQFASTDGFDREDNNARNQSLSPHDVVVEFQDQGFQVSHSDWGQIRYTQVDEFSSCEYGRGYVVIPAATTGMISYPKFQTQYGTCVSLGNGVWEPTLSTYDRSRLKVINYNFSGELLDFSVRSVSIRYMGLVTNELNTNSHNGVRDGLMGAVMAEIGLPDLNILDCIRVVAHPEAGPGVSCQYSTQLNQLVASTDPIAVDIWATTHILIPAFLDNGYTPPWPDPDATPDDPDSVFRTYLDNSMSLLLAEGYRVTNDLESIDAYTWAGMRAPRRPTGRVGG